MAVLRLPFPQSARRRIGPALIALAIELLIAIALLFFVVAPKFVPKAAPSLSMFDVSERSANARSAASPAKAQRARTQPKQPVTPQPVTLPPPPPIPVAHPTFAPPPGLIVLDRDQFAKSDIGKMPARPSDGAGDDGAGSGKDSGTAYGPGAGPGGQPLYNAEWYREPHPAEMATYLPRGLHSGVALIACRTIENYHVENCQSLGEEPAGIGLARAVRQAAWQFLVRPPRRGGKPLIGAWVRIRYEIVPVTKDAPDDASDPPGQ